MIYFLIKKHFILLRCFQDINGSIWGEIIEFDRKLDKQLS